MVPHFLRRLSRIIEHPALQVVEHLVRAPIQTTTFRVVGVVVTLVAVSAQTAQAVAVVPITLAV